MFLGARHLVCGCCFTLYLDYFCAAAGRQGWPAGAGRRGLGAAATGWGARNVVVFFQYALSSLCSNKKYLSPAAFGGCSRSLHVLSSDPAGRNKMLAPGGHLKFLARSPAPMIDLTC